MDTLYYDHWFQGLPIEQKAIVVGIEPLGAVGILRTQVDNLWNQMSDDEKIASLKNAQTNQKFITATKEMNNMANSHGYDNEKNSW